MRPMRGSARARELQSELMVTFVEAEDKRRKAHVRTAQRRSSRKLLGGASLFFSLAFSLLPSALTGPRTQTPPSAPDLARLLQAHYNTVRDFTADFTHAYRGGALRQSMTESGQVRIKKPGRMRWTYTAPEKKEFISDGSKMYSYIPSEKLVIVSDLPPADQAPTGLLFLTGRGDLVRDFRAALPKAQPPNGWQLDLIPNTKQQDLTSLTLIVDPHSLVLRSLSTIDAQEGVSTFTFTSLHENVGLADSLFDFKIPRGVEIRR
jgi:outer membrane lipoprotein carrier protein